MGDISLGISCPSCGGALKADEGAKSVSCNYCNALIWLEGDEGVHTIMFANMVDRTKALNLTHEWFRRGLKARDLKKAGVITEIFPLYLPFWRLNARAAGWVCGYRERQKYDSQGRPAGVEREYMERMVFRDFDWTYLACDPGDIGVKRLRNLYGQVIPANVNEVPTFEVTTSKTDALNMGIQNVHQMAVQSANVQHITFQKIHVIPRQFMLVYYPVWIVRYKYQERVYFATIDGVLGKVVAGRAPGDPLYQSLIMTGGSVGGGLAAAAGVYLALTGISEELGILAIVGGVVLLIASYLFFRHGSEVVEGDIEAKYKGFSIKKAGEISSAVGGLRI
ncbi:MAG: hypothetical protein N3F63_05720 [Thermoplasmata archaeon]|nr:hypothetical protein [Thermoplasmata archaeon]